MKKGNGKSVRWWWWWWGARGSSQTPSSSSSLQLGADECQARKLPIGQSGVSWSLSPPLFPSSPHPVFSTHIHTHSPSLASSLFFFSLPPASFISPLPCCSGLSLHIFSCHPLCYLSHCHFPASHLPLSLFFFFSFFSGCLVDSFYCLSPCRYTLGRAPPLWTGYVWAYLLQR